HVCEVGEFLCHDRVSCVSQNWLCDGDPDCPDESDEASYKKVQCFHEMTKETMKYEQPTKMNINFMSLNVFFSSHGPEKIEFKCPLNHIKCTGSNRCIHMSQLCNGVYDCPDEYDEGVHCRVLGKKKETSKKGVLAAINHIYQAVIKDTVSVTTSNLIICIILPRASENLISIPLTTARRYEVDLKLRFSIPGLSTSPSASSSSLATKELVILLKPLN
ncbi:Low-density lipoprotein receptor-related protein 1B, partial [Ophiophagus hannah]